MEALIYAHLSSPIPDVRRARKEVSVETSRIIKRMMAKKPQDRYGTYPELIEAIEQTIYRVRTALT
jgi:hypothetical protein